MPSDHTAAFPIPADVLPSRLRALLGTIGLSPQQAVEVAGFYEAPAGSVNNESVTHQMALVPDDGDGPLELHDAGHGVIAHSVPVDRKGIYANFSPSLSGHDYIVASWGSGSFYTYHLAEKVWMTLGLTPRCVGNEHQKLIYDDLRLPEFSVAQGEISSEYHWKSNRNISWTMSNEYLRKYLWLRGARGIRVFYYKGRIDDHPAVRNLMGRERHVELKPETGSPWYTIDIREHKDGLLLQVWASVEAVSSELCEARCADGVVWPGDTVAMTHERANALISGHQVFLDDRFLERYEQNSFYDTTPTRIDDTWYCSPSYKGQWAFTDCVRVGRNLIKVPMRELYKPKPDREILHARDHALDNEAISDVCTNAEHVVSKVQRFLEQLLALGDNVSALGSNVGLQKRTKQLLQLLLDELESLNLIH